MSKRAKGGSAVGSRFRISLGLPVGALINCADNSGARTLYIIAVVGKRGCLNRLPSSCPGDKVLVSVKKGKPDLRKKVMSAVIVRQRKAICRKNGKVVVFDDNAGVLLNPTTGSIKGSTIMGTIAAECAECWPRIAACASSVY
ncbi:hypothetical protein A3Q56_06241 [Intoshia linei]|uniref:Large ribosomal subunit protein uL14 n=1 Tax=Intoshia linei TaxID=1819745 RepID=A0A177AXX5_9BILA|nr:hypothetical protein A3Q56_06241 [Intoshia linei]